MARLVRLNPRCIFFVKMTDLPMKNYFFYMSRKNITLLLRRDWKVLKSMNDQS